MPRAIPESRFQDLIEAATAVLLEQGYRRTQIADVAERMGVAKGSVYTYVESKEALLDCVLRFADRPAPIALPETLPVPTPKAGATLQMVRRKLASENALPSLDAALLRKRVVNLRTELEEILAELYDLLARNRTGIKLLDRCAPDYPELARVWNRAGRAGALARLSRYLDERGRRGRLRRFTDEPVAARLVLETLVFWAVHRHWDPAPQTFDEASAKRTVVEFLASALLSPGSRASFARRGR
jgi:AcrR family transcriptional regulator